MTDWKGNEIKPGMEICFIRVIDRQTWRFGMYIPVAPGVHVEHMEEKRPDKQCWEIGEYYKVGKDLKITVKKGNYTLSQPLDFLRAFSDIDMGCSILAIKGISDKREDYEKRNII